MDKLLAIKIPGFDEEINPPPGVPDAGANTLSNAIGVGIQLFLIVVILASLGYIVWAGINWIRSEGDPQKLHSARMQIVFAIVGLMVALLAFGIIGVFSSFFNVKLI